MSSNFTKILLPQVEQFVKVALEEIRSLRQELSTVQSIKIASEQVLKVKLDRSLDKAANALYESDFITDEIERNSFLKRAKEDPSYLADMLTKVCKAADVSQIGYPARVAKPKQAEYDPIMARAFGTHRGLVDIQDV